MRFTSAVVTAHLKSPDMLVGFLLLTFTSWAVGAPAVVNDNMRGTFPPGAPVLQRGFDDSSAASRQLSRRLSGTPAHQLARAGWLGRSVGSSMGGIKVGSTITLTNAAGERLVVGSTGNLGLCAGTAPQAPMQTGDCRDANAASSKWTTVPATVIAETQLSGGQGGGLLLLRSLSRLGGYLQDSGGVVAGHEPAERLSDDMSHALETYPGSLQLFSEAAPAPLDDYHLQWTITAAWVNDTGTAYYISSYYGRYLETRNGLVGFLHETVTPGPDQAWYLRWPLNPRLVRALTHLCTPVPSPP